MINSKKILRLTIIFIIAGIAIGILIGYWSVFIPFFIGLLIAYLLDPIVLFLERQKRLHLNRSISITIVFVLFLSITVGLVLMIYPVLETGVTKLSKTIIINEKNITDFFSKAYKWIENLELPLKIEKAKIMKTLTTSIISFLNSFFIEFKDITLSIIGSIPMLIIIPLIIFYFLKDKYLIFDTVKKYVEDEKEKKIKLLFQDIQIQLGGYIKGQFLLSLVVFIITTAAMLLFEIPYAVLIGLAGGILNIIPYFGPIISALPAVVLAIIYFQSSGHLIGVIVFFMIMNILVASLISPKIFSSATNLHPLFVILAVFLGASAFGMIGMILAIPLAIVIKTLTRQIFKIYIREI